MFGTIETDKFRPRAATGTHSPRLARREPQQAEVATDAPRLRGDVDVHDRQMPRADGVHETEPELRRTRRENRPVAGVWITSARLEARRLVRRADAGGALERSVAVDALVS